MMRLLAKACGYCLWEDDLKDPFYVPKACKLPHQPSTLRAPLSLILALFLLFCITGRANSQECSQSTVCTISGVVINGVSRSPISRALVELAGHGQLTDNEGRFVLKEIPGAIASQLLQQPIQNSWLTVRKPGYMGPDGSSMSRDLDPTNNNSGSSPSSFVLLLYPEATISGSLVDPAGAPVSHAVVELSKKTNMDGFMRWQPFRQQSTDARGEFFFGGLSSGNYSVTTQIAIDLDTPRSNPEAYLSETYPASAPGEEPLPLHLTLGQTANIQIPLKKEKCYPVNGIVQGDGSTEPSSLQLQSINGTPLFLSLNYNPRTGLFHSQLPPGSYTVIATKNRQNKLYGTTTFTVVPGKTTEVSVSLSQMPSIQVKVDAPPPAAQQQPSTQTNFRNARLSDGPERAMNITLVPFSSHQPSRWSTVSGTPERPQLIIADVPPGKYFVRAICNSFWYVKSVTVGGVDVTREPLVITGASGTETMQITLGSDFGELRAKVTDGMSNAQGYYYLLPTDFAGAGAFAVRQGRIPTSGEIHYSQMAPGDYLFLAFDRMQSLDFRNPDVFQQLALQGKTVRVPAGGSVSIEVERIHGKAGE